MAYMYIALIEALKEKICESKSIMPEVHAHKFPNVHNAKLQLGLFTLNRVLTNNSTHIVFYLFIWWWYNKLNKLYCERNNEPLGSIKCSEILEWLHNWLFLKEGSVLLS
jgi:hypothetical protein